MKYGGGGGTRTPDRVIMIHLLYRLSYTAKKRSAHHTGYIFQKSTAKNTQNQYGVNLRYRFGLSEQVS